MHDHDRGLGHDLETLLKRRRLLLLGGTSLLAFGVAACGGGGEGDTTSASGAGSSTSTPSGGAATSADSAATVASRAASDSSRNGCALIPEETAGPYSADGSNAAVGGLANALTLSGIVRADIRSSIAGATGRAAGVPLAVTLQLVDTDAGCAGLVGYAVYLWHCDREGRYSMYSSGVTAENYLRGVQVTDAGGKVTFMTVFPGCYAGRMPHIHFEIYRGGSMAANPYTHKLRTSQLALPTDVCTAVYRSEVGYSASVRNFSSMSFAGDNVFADGVTKQLATVTGDLASGYAARLRVGISV